MRNVAALRRGRQEQSRQRMSMTHFLLTAGQGIVAQMAKARNTRDCALLFCM